MPSHTRSSSQLTASHARQESIPSVPSTAGQTHGWDGPYPGPAERAKLLEPGPPRVAQPVVSQFPPNSPQQHVEYVLVASFDIDRGSVMERQYPGPVGGDEHMLAELMLPEGTHMRSQDWTIFFLHPDSETNKTDRPRRRRKIDSEDETDEDNDADEPDVGSRVGSDEVSDGPPLVYVLNLVNTKQDTSVKRGAVVKAMAICTRHAFLHIYKPLLLLGLEQYFANPTMDTLASLYHAVNNMDLSLMPKLNVWEKYILQSTDARDLFIEKFEAMIAQRTQNGSLPPPSPTGQSYRLGLPRDTHELESVVHYANVPVPVKVPVALACETVGDFSLIKLITIFSTPHSTSPVPFSPPHPHLTTNGPLTHPIIVLLNALLTQKRVLFLGHNMPSSEVAEAVLGACALASGGILKGFTRHAFPYTDLSKIDDLLQVPGFIAGVTNPVFQDQPQWWDLICDLGTGRMKISSRLEQPPPSEGVMFFHSQQKNGGSYGSMGPGGGSNTNTTSSGSHASTGLSSNSGNSNSGTFGDATGDIAFMASLLKAIEERHGENAIRARFRKWVVKFIRIAAAFEETVYGASALAVQSVPPTPTTPFAESSPFAFPTPTSLKSKSSGGLDGEAAEPGGGHGYIWSSAALKTAELAANAARIEGWRNKRSYRAFVAELSEHHNNYHSHVGSKAVDLQHLHDKLAKLRLGPEASAQLYHALAAAVRTERDVLQLLTVVVNSTWDPKGNPAGPGSPGVGLFYIVLGLSHPYPEVRAATAKLLDRIQGHEAGRHFWNQVGRAGKSAWRRIIEARSGE
ncbi:spindle pole body interacting protein [Piedraia hortae CBS 480.64]|uniref:Spindle pole body interacting protein n=1 Tax=Piedraia hortae CBS 480.64 TaxID=1314780 RepID=A0A6A7C7P8_9PEZI|nr:spindle pole body interacting protein [Piedraia hortae CBS 480.64]